MKLNRICRSAMAVLLFFPFVTGANTGSCGGSVTVGSGASSEAGSSGASAGPGGPVLQDAGPEPGDAPQGTPPDDATASSSLGPCDPLAPPPTTLGAVMGVGQGPGGTLYVVDRSSPSSSSRVFVSSGNTLYRQHVEGSGQRGATDYSFGFADPSAYGHLPADGGGSQSLLLQVQGGTATAMQVGPPSGKGFLGDPGVVGTPLTVLPPSSVAGMKLQNLPGVVGHVADVAGGNALVVTQPMDDYSTTNLRLFYGPSNAMVERSILQAQQSMSGNTDITFLVGSSEYTVHFLFAFALSSMPGPVTVDAGDGGTIAATERWPVPTVLNGFMFDCFGAQASSNTLPACPLLDPADASYQGCAAARAYVNCTATNGGGAACLSNDQCRGIDITSFGCSSSGGCASGITCSDACNSNEFGVACGAVGPAGGPPIPSTCRSTSVTPGGIVFGCCPCSTR
jgi:hypothetical protein